MEQIISLIIPFITLALFSVMIDKLTLFLVVLMSKIPNFPDQYEWPTAYFFILVLSYVVCWQGSFNLFEYLNVSFQYEWQGYLMTALLLSGGSALVRTGFSMIESIPSVLSGISTTVQRVVRRPVRVVEEKVEVIDSAPTSSSAVRNVTEYDRYENSNRYTDI